MSSDIYTRMLEEAGSVRPLVEKVIRVLHAYADDTIVDPEVLARQSTLTDVQLLAALNILQRSGFGQLEIAVLNRFGQPVAFFPNADAVTETVTDDYGVTWTPEPRDLRVVYRPKNRAVAEAR